MTEKPNKLELGSGERCTPGYLHHDIVPIEGAKLDFVCKPWEIPLDEGSISEILALGVMEHMRFDNVGKTLRHMYLLLQDGGEFLLDVPDMKVWSEYLLNVTHDHPEKNPFPPEHVWRTIYGWQRWEGDEHKSGWTRDMILRALKEAGFEKIEEGVELFTSKGFERRRFARPEDAHIYLKVTK